MQRILFGLLALGLVAACGGEEKKSPQTYGGEADEACGCGCACGDEEEVASGGVYTADQGTATVRGVVKWDGEAPKRRKIDLGADKYCESCHPDGALSETAIVGPDGGFANVFVTVKSGLRGWKFETPAEAKKLDQVQCTYVPHVLGIQVGQTLEIHNSDPTMHNIHAINASTRRDEFNFAQSKKGAVDKRSFRRPATIAVKCDVHGWMSSTIHVVKHPFYAVTGEDGAFELSGLPAGTYTLEARHEKYGTQTLSVTVADGATAEAAFTFRKS